MAEPGNGEQTENKRERDPITGRFLPNNGGGPGRPRGSTKENYKDAIRSATTLKDIIEIWQGALADAKSKNAATRQSGRKFVFEVLGLIEILVDVTSAGEKVGPPDAAALAEALAILGAANGN